MDLSSPMSSVIPGVYGHVLTVLARTTKQLNARQVATLTNGRASFRRVNDVLQELTVSGLVMRQDSPPSYLYRLNRDHVAAAGIIELANLREVLLTRIKDDVADWTWQAAAVWLFGSAAKGTADTHSDVDLLVVADDDLPDTDAWAHHVSSLSEKVNLWTGNDCEILELTVSELRAAVESENRLVADLRSHGRLIHGGRSATSLLTSRVTKRHSA